MMDQQMQIKLSDRSLRSSPMMSVSERSAVCEPKVQEYTNTKSEEKEDYYDLVF